MKLFCPACGSPILKSQDNKILDKEDTLLSTPIRCICDYVGFISTTKIDENRRVITLQVFKGKP
jgi:hypothetical protein